MTSILRTLAIVATLAIGIALLPPAPALPSQIFSLIDIGFIGFTGSAWAIPWNELWEFATTWIVWIETLMFTLWAGFRLLKFIR